MKFNKDNYLTPIITIEYVGLEAGIAASSATIKAGGSPKPEIEDWESETITKDLTL